MRLSAGRVSEQGVSRMASRFLSCTESGKVKREAALGKVGQKKEFYFVYVTFQVSIGHTRGIVR